jgi:hypothetical protein
VDGDTIVVLDAQKAQHRVPLGGIDAPERGQSCVRKSKDNLARLVAGQEVLGSHDTLNVIGTTIAKRRVEGALARLDPEGAIASSQMGGVFVQCLEVKCKDHQ